MPSTRIREIRKRRGLTLQALADRVGTTAQTIQRLETDNMMVSIEWLRRIAGALELAPGEFVRADRIATIACLGRADADGLVAVSRTGEDQVMLQLPDLEPIAVRLSEAIGEFAAGTVLLGARIDDAKSIEPAGRDCIVATTDGRILLRHVSRARAGKLVLRRPGGDGALEAGVDIEWLAPVRLALRVIP